MRILVLISAVVLLCLTAAAQVKPTVSVIGQASLSIAPDQVVFTFEIVTDNKEIVAAKRENDARTSRTLATAAAFGIGPKEIQTDSLTITPQYTGEKDPRGSHVLVSYEVTKRVLVTLKNLDQIDSFVSKADFPQSCELVPTTLSHHWLKVPNNGELSLNDFSCFERCSTMRYKKSLTGQKSGCRGRAGWGLSFDEEQRLLAACCGACIPSGPINSRLSTVNV